MSATMPVAPDGLEPVRRFVNTRDVEASTDALGSPQQVADWLRDAGLAEGGLRVAGSDVRRCVELREALRSALVANHHRTRIPPDSLAVLNRAGDRAALRVAFSADADWSMRPGAAGVDGALGTLVALTAQAMSQGTWPRLKVCANDTCAWAFYDHSRARTGKWCSMAICGNRAKQQAWRSRQ